MTVKDDKSGTGGSNDGKPGATDTNDGKKPDGSEGDGDGDGDGDGGGDGSPDESKLDDSTKKYIKKLRSENAKRRTEQNNLKTQLDGLTQRIKKLAGDEDELPPEQQIEGLEATAMAQAFDNAVLEMAVEHGIGKKSLKYFKFLISEAAGNLDEGEELDDESIAQLAKEVKAAAGGAAGGTTTSVNGDGGKGEGGGGDKTTVEQFAKMSTVERSVLFRKDAQLYETLRQEAKAKRLYI